MKHLGHIEIRDKVIFVYYELEKPKKYLFTLEGYRKPTESFNIALKLYNASKQEVEVSNARAYKYLTFDYANVFIEDKNSSFPIIFNFENDQPCEADVENEIATILKIL